MLMMINAFRDRMARQRATLPLYLARNRCCNVFTALTIKLISRTQAIKLFSRTGWLLFAYSTATPNILSTNTIEWSGECDIRDLAATSGGEVTCRPCVAPISLSRFLEMEHADVSELPNAK